MTLREMKEQTTRWLPCVLVTITCLVQSNRAEVFNSLIHRHNDDFLVDLCDWNTTNKAIYQTGSTYDHGFLQVINSDANESYPPNFHCRVELVPFEDHVTTVWLLWIDIPPGAGGMCNTDYVEVFGSIKQWKRYRFCGNSFPIRILRSEGIGQSVYISFTSGDNNDFLNNSKTGFAIRYSWDRYHMFAVRLGDIAIVSAIFVALILGMVLTPLLIMKLANKWSQRHGDSDLEADMAAITSNDMAAAAGLNNFPSIVSAAMTESTPDLPPPYPIQPIVNLPEYMTPSEDLLRDDCPPPYAVHTEVDQVHPAEEQRSTYDNAPIHNNFASILDHMAPYGSEYFSSSLTSLCTDSEI